MFRSFKHTKKNAKSLLVYNDDIGLLEHYDSFAVTRVFSQVYYSHFLKQGASRTTLLAYYGGRPGALTYETDIHVPTGGAFGVRFIDKRGSFGEAFKEGFFFSFFFFFFFCFLCFYFFLCGLPKIGVIQSAKNGISNQNLQIRK